MTFSARGPRLQRMPSLWLLLPIVAVIIGLILLATVGTSLYADLLFYREVHFTTVFSTVLRTRLLLFFLAGILGAVAVAINMVVAYALRPTYVPMSVEQQQLERYRVAVQPYRRGLVIVVGAFFGLLFGLAGQHDWRLWLLWEHGQSFGVTDPQFHRDISYYAFTLPFERTVLTFAFAAVVVSILVTAALHYGYGAIRLQTRGEKVSAAARAHLSVLMGLFVLLKAAAYYLDRFGLNFSPRGSVTGAGYADIHATLPAKTILLFIAVLCAGLFFANGFRRGFTLPAVSFGLLVLSAIVIGGIYPFIVQQFKVKPNEINREAPYIARNIAGTRQAYLLEPATSTAGTSSGNIVTTDYNAPAQPAASAVTATNPNIANARLLDPNQLQQTFEQLQQVRSYYGFPQALDIDRYTLGGQEQSYVVATRDVNLAGLRSDQQNWPNEHLVYTHGQGFVAAATNQVDSNGRPVFAVKDIPATGPTGGPPPIAITQSRIYYGELSPTYSVVDTKQLEVDGTDQANYHYDGSGGVPVGGKLFRRLALALHFRDYNLFFSSAVTQSSRILYYRDPRLRVAKVAPWLTLDGDPYPAVIDGRIEWIVDGYTTSDNYPYSQRVSLGGATTDAATAAGTVAAQRTDNINYIRNSVKATVDAFTGQVTLYAFENGTPDPVLRTWEKIFPGTVQPETSIPPDLRVHLRYPEDLFNVQRDLLAKYHVSDPKAFFQGTDFWQVPDDPEQPGTAQPPYYLETQVPGESTTEFNLTSTLTFLGRPNLAAYVAVSSDPSDYGTMRVLDLPSNTVINGPANVENAIKSDATFGPQYTLLNENGSKVVIGNQLALTVGGGLLFVEPIYTQATAGQSFPLLRYVVVVYGDKVGFAPTLQGALIAALSGGGSGPSLPGPTQPGPSPSTGGGPQGMAALRAAVSADFAAADAALKSGDLGGYQRAVAKAMTDYQALLTAQGVAGPSAGHGSGSPTSSASAAASRSP